MNDFDYRILNYKKIADKYDEFLQSRPPNDRNEFEPKAENIFEIEEKIGFVPNTIVVVFFPYVTFEKLEVSKKSNLSVHAVSKDYHNIVKKFLEEFCAKILQDEKSLYYIQADNGFFSERFFAIQSGLCGRGKNGLAIHREFGSYGFLGIIAFEKFLPEKISPMWNCMDCGKCIIHCPAQAISERSFDGNKCISYLTQKKQLTEQEKNILKEQSKIYGCDVCQLCCPENECIKYVKIGDFSQDLLYNIDLEKLIKLTNKEFKKIYGTRNFAWRGKSVLVRNLRLKENE